LNATVALIEGRTELAKEILRGPGSDVRNVPEILARLDRAVNGVAAKTLRAALLRSLSAQPDPRRSGVELDEYSMYEQGFYTGVARVEAILEDIASSLEQRVGN
jgi:hypothetical protein